MTVAPLREKRGATGLIATVMIGIVMLAALGWVASEMVSYVPENDNLGVSSTLKDKGPLLIKMVIMALALLAVGAILRTFGVL